MLLLLLLHYFSGNQFIAETQLLQDNANVGTNECKSCEQNAQLRNEKPQPAGIWEAKLHAETVVTPLPRIKEGQLNEVSHSYITSNATRSIGVSHPVSVKKFHLHVREMQQGDKFEVEFKVCVSEKQPK